MLKIQKALYTASNDQHFHQECAKHDRNIEIIALFGNSISIFKPGPLDDPIWKGFQFEL